MYDSETLQFERALELFARETQTPMGRQLAEELAPHQNRFELESDLELLSEVLALREEEVRWRFSAVDDPSECLSRLRIKDAALEPGELRLIASILGQVLEVRSLIKEYSESAARLWGVVEPVNPELRKATEEINRKILPNGELDDSASTELKRIRRETNSLRARVTGTLEGLMRSKADAVQDEIVTIRNDRFVIPVKADFKGKIGGVAHGSSSSGATVFIEPLEAIEANNELQTLKAQEEAEIYRILQALTEGLRKDLPLVEIAVDAVAMLDILNAKAAFAKLFDAITPEISDESRLELIEARHPLLEEGLRKDEGGVVPTTIELSAEQPVMVISGANAGGKTVVLKTAGLLSLMAVSGLPVPAERASVPFYSSILADIGDRQSIAANLSTFSSHISNIARMMENAEAPSLILLDEVGTGTDPEEGSALGIAVVEKFRSIGAQVIASTHYRGLKIYAETDENVINASVEFDERTLEPTYRLITGMAGASSGLEMAKRFGIDDEVIESARRNLDAAAREASDYLQRLQAEVREAGDLRAALESEREAVADRYAKLDVEFHKKERERIEAFEKETERIVADLEKRSREFLKTVKDKKERRKLEKTAAKAVSELKTAAAGAVADLVPAGKKKRESADGDSGVDVIASEIPIDSGSEVLLKKFGTVGKVEKISGDEAEVVVGSMRMRQKLDDLQAVRTNRPVRSGQSAAKQADGSILDESAARESLRELNLIGKTTYDADIEVDKFLDEAYVARLDSVRIIHGFGTGALKNAVHQMLKGHPHVEGFGFAPQNEGGRGATIVSLKK